MHYCYYCGNNEGVWNGIVLCESQYLNMSVTEAVPTGGCYNEIQNNLSKKLPLLLQSSPKYEQVLCNV